MCRAAEDAGADFVKTSTGFHPSGGASVRAVELMAARSATGSGSRPAAASAPPHDAVAMLDAGATRLGLSGTRAVLDGLDFRAVSAARHPACPVGRGLLGQARAGCGGGHAGNE